MADVPQMPLKEFFKLFAPTFVLGTTYTISLAFFEGMVYPEINRKNLRRCLLLCDKLGFHRATIESSALRSVGREYMAICVPAQHSFHPKVWLMIGEGKAALLVGSGNLTQSGFMDNNELFDVVELTEGGPSQTVAKDIASFLAGLRSFWPGVSARRLLAIETLDEMQKALEDIARKMPNEKDPDVRFLSNFNGPLVEQFRDFFLGGTMRVAAPYFGGGTMGLRILQEKLRPTQIGVFPAVHRGNELDVSIAELDDLNGVSVHALKMGRKNAFSHLKAYGFDSDGGQWFFTTSANCTLSALGGDNVEAGLLRRVKRDVLDQYFAEKPSEELPTKVRTSDFVDGDNWFPFWAVDRGNKIELLVNDSAKIPLANVTVTIKVGGISDSYALKQLFHQGTVAHIEWEKFQQIKERTKNTPLISIEAIDATGQSVRGDSLVDNPLLLSSDPTHRSAWRAAMSLLEGEGLPESSDLACIFHLVQNIFDADDELPRSVVEQKGLAPTSQSRIVIPDKVPIWPPVADHDLYGTTAGTGQLQDLQWFQRILAEFLNPKHDDEDTTTKTADGADEEVTTESKADRVPTRIVKSVWKQASSSYEQLQSRLSKIVVTKNSSRKIWAVATAVFVATLLTRRQLLKYLEDETYIPNSDELIRGFVRMLFVERIQHADFSPPANCRYCDPTFPSLAEDLHETFQQDPSIEVAGIICLLFAYWHVAEAQTGGRIPANAWLLFLDVAPTVACGIDIDLASLKTVFKRYIFVESEGILWADIESSIEHLSKLSWKDHTGFRELCAIMRRASGQQYAVDFPEHLNERWLQTDRRIRYGKEWHFAVEALSETCAADDCSGQCVIDPKKRRDLRRLAPTICSSCGAVLVPSRLWRAYEESHE